MDGDDRFSSEKSDVDVISKIYELYAPRMRRMAYHMLRDYHRAEDAVHIVFAAMLKNRDKLVFDVESKATRTYLCTAVRRTVYNMQRDNKKYKLADEEDENDHFFGIDDGRQIIEAVTVEEVMAKLRALPPQYSQVMLLRFVHNYTSKQVAGMLGIDEALVRQRVRRARLMLRRMDEPGGK